MRLYLQRHAEPKPGAQMDASRGLTSAGERQAEEMSSFLADQVGRVDIVITSPFLRASETADIMAAALGAHVASSTMLEPNQKPADAWAEIERLAQQSEDVLVVGHHPEMAHLIDHIAGVTGIAHHFSYGSIACIQVGPASLREGWVTLEDGDHIYIGSDGKAYGGSSAHDRSEKEKGGTDSIDKNSIVGDNNSMENKTEQIGGPDDRFVIGSDGEPKKPSLSLQRIHVNGVPKVRINVRNATAKLRDKLESLGYKPDVDISNSRSFIAHSPADVDAARGPIAHLFDNTGAWR